jgi:hypothetical protein
MKWFTVTRSARMLALKITLWGATAALTLFVPVAHSQQEVAPAWYDPWAAQTRVVGPASQSQRVPDQKPQRKASSVTSNRQPQRPRGKRSAVAEASRAKTEVGTTERNRF